MLYSDLENDIIERLSTISGVDVRPQPENETEANVKAFSPLITVSYQHSEFSGSLTRGLPEMFSTDDAVQDEFAEIHVVLQARLLRGESGIYSLLDKIRKKLHGYRPGIWGRMFLKICDYLSNEDGLWTWDVVFVTKRPIAQEFTDDHGEDQPNLISSIFETNLQ